MHALFDSHWWAAALMQRAEIDHAREVALAEHEGREPSTEHVRGPEHGLTPWERRWIYERFKDRHDQAHRDTDEAEASLAEKAPELETAAREEADIADEHAKEHPQARDLDHARRVHATRKVEHEAACDRHHKCLEHRDRVLSTSNEDIAALVDAVQAEMRELAVAKAAEPAPTAE